MTTKAESNYLSAVAASGCILCGAPAEIHHHRRMGEKRKHSQVIPLCPAHHRGSNGLHGIGKKSWERMHGVNLDELCKAVRCKVP